MDLVSISGIGQTPVREHWNASTTDLAIRAGRLALADAGQDTADLLVVANMTDATLSGQSHLGAKVADRLGMRGAEAVRIGAACGSGAMAIRQGIIAIASGAAKSALIVGVEKLTSRSGAETAAALAQAADADYEAIYGASFVGLNALLMRRYMYEYGYVQADFAPFAVNAHRNAINNPYALFQRPVSLAEYQAGRVVSTPLTLFDAAPIADGAAAVVLRAGRKAPSDVRITGSAAATDTLALHDREDLLWLQAAERSASRAYNQAGTGPEDIDLFELHDAFTVMSALSLEACGFAARGEGVGLAQAGEIFPGGRIPIATTGGLKARGHPVGATGVYQIVEATQQLRGTAGKAQIGNARTAMTQNIGGSGATIVTHILQR